MKMSDGGKGSGRRPKQISKEEEDLRWKLAFGKITQQEFDEAIEGLWNEDRIDIVGQNGNTGEHYPDPDQAYQRVHTDYSED